MINFVMFRSRKKKTGDADANVNQGQQLILSEHLQVKRDLGEGQYGVVQLGLWDPQNGTKPKYVAIKSLKNTAFDGVLQSVLEEARTMQRLSHNNIVKMYGISLPSRDEPLKLVTEYAPYGSLEDNLKNKKSEVCRVSTLSKYAIQIAEGMNYLASLNLVHRDLSTRNILVFEPDLVKISDFGLARTLEGGAASQITVHRKLAVAWLPPEAIKENLFTLWSDIWSYGITLWEMFSFGDQPWAELTLQQIKVMMTNQPTKHLVKPVACPDGFYEIMLGCWEPHPKSRPTFGYISNRLSKLQPREGITRVGHNTAEEGHLSYNCKVKVAVISKREDGLLLVQSETGHDHIGLVHEKNLDFSKKAFQKRASNSPGHISRPYDIKTENPKELLRKLKKTSSVPLSGTASKADVEEVLPRKRLPQTEENAMVGDLLDLGDDATSDPTNPLDPQHYAGNKATEHAQLHHAATGGQDYERLVVHGATGSQANQQLAPQDTTTNQANQELIPQNTTANQANQELIPENTTGIQPNDELAPQGPTENLVTAPNTPYMSMEYAGQVDGVEYENDMSMDYMSMNYQQRNLGGNQDDNATVAESQHFMSHPDHRRPPRTQSESDVVDMDSNSDYAVPYQHRKCSQDDNALRLGSKTTPGGNQTSPSDDPAKKPPPDIPERVDLQENKFVAAGGAGSSATVPRTPKQRRPVPTPRKLRPISADTGAMVGPRNVDLLPRSNSESNTNKAPQSQVGEPAKKVSPPIPSPYQPARRIPEEQGPGKIAPVCSEMPSEDQTGDTKELSVEVEDQPSRTDSSSEQTRKNKHYIIIRSPIPNGQGSGKNGPSRDPHGQEMSSQSQAPLPPAEHYPGVSNKSDSSQVIEERHYVNSDAIKRLSADFIDLFSNPEDGAAIADPIYDKPINLPPLPDIPEEIVNQPPPLPSKLFGGTLGRDLDTSYQPPIGDWVFPAFQSDNSMPQPDNPVTEPVNPVPQPVYPAPQDVTPGGANNEGTYGEEIDAGIREIRQICGEEVSRDWCYAALLQYQGDIEQVVQVIKTQKLSKITGKTEQFCKRTLNHCNWDLNRAAVYILENFADKDV